MSSGKWQFFIQNGRTSRPVKRKTIPCSLGIDSRNISPCAFSSSVRASSSEMTRPEGRTTRGPDADADAGAGDGRGEEADPAGAHAARKIASAIPASDRLDI